MEQKKKKTIAEQIKKLPKKPGVYFFRNKTNKLVYIGKAKNILKRVISHFRGTKEVLPLKEKMLGETAKIKFKETETEIDALILESSLIKKHLPKYNVLLRDDKNFFFVGVTKEEFPRIFITHRPLEIQNLKRKIKNNKYNLQPTTHNLQPSYIGPFTDGKSLKLILRLLRRIFPYRHCKTMPKTSCLQYHLNRCAGFCELHSQESRANHKSRIWHPAARNDIKKRYLKDIANINNILTGKKQTVLKKWEKEMIKEAEKENFEKAAKIRDNIAALQKIFAHSPVLKKEDVDYLIIEKELKKALKTKKSVGRIEAYDISNIQGKDAVGSMAVFEKGKPKKSDYRRFKINMKNEPNDPAMIKEIVERRLRHPEWPIPDLIVIDGGTTQLNAAKKTFKRADFENILLCSIAKNPDRIIIGDKKIPLKSLSGNLELLLRQIRDEAHRFAANYHRKLRKKKIVPAAKNKNH